MVIQQLNVFDGLKYSRIVLQFHGLIGFRYKNGRLIESRFLKIVPVLYMIAFSISMSIGFIFSQIRDLQEHPEGDQDEGSLRNIISMAELVFVIFGFFVFVISSRLNLKDHIKFIDDVNSIDELFLKHFNTGVNYRSFRARNITALTVCVVLNFVVISSVVKVDFVTLQHFEEYFFAGAYLLENSLAIMVSVTFIQYLNLIRYHFIALNDCIESTRLHIQENYLEYGYLKEPMITKVNNDIKIIYKLYRDICSSIETFNRFFGTMMAISILHDIALTLSLLYVYMTIINIQGNISSLPLFSILVWMFPNFAKLMTTSISAEMIQDTAAKCAKSFKRFDTLGLSQENIDVLDSFSLWLSHYKVRVTARNIFDINAALLYSIIGTVTNNLFVLIQLQMQEDQYQSTDDSNKNIRILNVYIERN